MLYRESPDSLSTHDGDDALTPAAQPATTAKLPELSPAPYLGSLDHPRSRLAYLGKHGRFVASGSPDFEPQADDCVYRFNSLGYRGEEFNPRAAFKLFVFGCSYTFGMGLRYDRTWPYLLKQAVAARLSLRRAQVNLQNFSQLGASNSYIARTVLDQCARVHPDLAVIHFTHHQRTEYLGRDARWCNDIEHLGSWNRQERAGPGNSLTPGLRYLRHYTHRAGLLDTLKDMYLVQCALKRRGIPYVFVWNDAKRFFRSPIATSPALRDVASLIDQSRVCPISIVGRGIKVDTIGKGDGHPGLKAQARFVAGLLDWLPSLPVKADAGRAAPPADRPTAGGGTMARPRLLAIGVRSCACAGDTHERACTDAFARMFGGRYRDAVRRGATVQDPVVSGTSNDALVRRLLIECRSRPPDLVLMAFADPGRCEHVIAGFLGRNRLVELGPPIRSNGPSAGRRQARSERAYSLYASDELRWRNALKNMLLAQEHLKVSRTRFVFAPPPGFAFDAGGALAHPVLRSLASRLDRACLAADGAPQPQIPQLPADPAPGTEPGWRRRLATYLVRLKARRLSKDGDPNIYPLW